MSIDVGVAAKFLVAKHATVDGFSIDVSGFADGRSIDSGLDHSQSEKEIEWSENNVIRNSLDQRLVRRHLQAI